MRSKHQKPRTHKAKTEKPGSRKSGLQKSGQGGFGWGSGQKAGRPFSRQIDADLTEDPNADMAAADSVNPEDEADLVSTEFSGADFPEINPQAEPADSSAPPITLAVVRERAVRLLVNREHGRLELEQKLQQRELPQDLIDSVLDQLAEEGLQCDARFAESYTRMRVDRGYGPNKIRADLQTRRVDHPVIEDAIRVSGADWHSVAGAALAKKFGRVSVADVNTRSKMQRYLYQRGFAMDEIRSAIDGYQAVDSEL